MPGDDPDAPGRLTAHPAADAERLRGELDHYDRSQLWFQVQEIVAQFGIGRIDLLKIDVEQAEADVLAGIRGADWPLIRQLAAEVHDVDGRLAAFVGELRGRGFEVETEQEPAFRDGPLHLLYAIR